MLNRSNIKVVGNTVSAVNLGTGVSVYGGKMDGTTLAFKTISATGGSVSVISSSDQIYISGGTSDISQSASGLNGSLQYNNGGTFEGSALNYDDSLGTFSYGVSPAEQYSNFVINTLGDYYTECAYYFRLKDCDGYNDLVSIGAENGSIGFIKTNKIVGIGFGLDLVGETVSISSEFTICDSSYLPLYPMSDNTIKNSSGHLYYYKDGWFRVIAKRNATLVAFASNEDIIVGDGTIPMLIPNDLNGFKLVDVIGGVSIPSTSNNIDVQVRRVRNGVGVNMLSNVLTFGANAYSSNSYTINTLNSQVQAGDAIYVDVDSAGTGAKGLFVTLTFDF